MLPYDDAMPSNDLVAEYLDKSPDYYSGYTSVLRELSSAQERGFQPTERQLVLAVTHSARIYTSARSGKFVSGRSPDWLHGRVDGLRSMLRRRVLADPQRD